MAVVFYNGGPDGFVNTYLGGPLSVSIIGTFANGTVFDLSAPASSAEIRYGHDEGISLDFVDTGFSFTGSNLKKENVAYVVNIDSPASGLKGSIKYHSVSINIYPLFVRISNKSYRQRAPAHYPCGLNTAGSDLQMVPHVGWSNAVPDAHATVSLQFTTDNTTLEFSDGIGYHDKNWGDTSFLASTNLWYWGHARLGPYSLVWFDAFDLQGNEYFSGYVAINGSVLESSCAAGASIARPWGANGAFPSNITTGIPQGLEVTFDLGDGQVLWANVTTGAVVIGGETGYARALGTVVGGVGGGVVHKGRALFEEFALIGIDTMF